MFFRFFSNIKKSMKELWSLNKWIALKIIFRKIIESNFLYSILIAIIEFDLLSPVLPIFLVFRLLNSDPDSLIGLSSEKP